MVGVNCTLSRFARAFSLCTVPSTQVTGRSPQISSATASKWARVLSTISGRLKLVVSSSLQ